MTILQRGLRNKLPTNDNLATFAVEPIKCINCIQKGWHDVNHIFNQGNFAAHISKFHSSSIGLNFQQTSLSCHLLSLCDIPAKIATHKALIETLPIVVCMNLWKHRCLEKYGVNKSIIIGVKFIILKYILHLLNSGYPYIQWLVKRT